MCFLKMLILSDDLLFYLLKFLNTLDIINLKRTSRKWYHIIKEKELKITVPKELRNYEYICNDHTFISIYQNIEDEPDDEHYELTVIRNGKEIELGENTDQVYKLPDKYRVYKNYIFITVDCKIIVYNLEKATHPCMELDTKIYLDFEIMNNYLILVTKTSIRTFDIDKDFEYYITYPFKVTSVFYDQNILIFHDTYKIIYFEDAEIKKIECDIDVMVTVRMISDSYSYLDKISVIKIYKGEMYVFYTHFDVIVISLKTKEVVRRFKIVKPELYDDKLIQIHNDFIYSCVSVKRTMYVYGLNGVLKYKINLDKDFQLGCEGDMIDLFINRKTGQILISSWYDDIRMIS